VRWLRLMLRSCLVHAWESHKTRFGVFPHRSTWVVVILSTLAPRVFNRHIMSSSYIFFFWLILHLFHAKMLLKISCNPIWCASLPLAGLHMSTSSFLLAYMWFFWGIWVSRQHVQNRIDLPWGLLMWERWYL